MKKILYVMLAVVAFGFASCGNKSAQGEAVDSTSVSADNDDAADEAAATAIAALSSQIEAGDATKIQECIESIKAKVAELVKENPDVAKEYVTKVQDYLRENADKIKEVVGDNAAVSAAVATISDVDPDAIVAGLSGDVDAAKDAAIETAKEKANEAVDAKVNEAKEAANAKIDEGKEAAKAKVDDAAKKAVKGLGF